MSLTSQCRRSQRCQRGMTGYRYRYDIDMISSILRCRRCKRCEGDMTGYRYRHDIANITISTMLTM